jgi:hypothetical protein
MTAQPSTQGWDVVVARGARWWADQVERLSPRRRALLRWSLAHPEAIVVPASAVIFGVFGVAYGGGDDSAFRHAGEQMIGPGFVDTFRSPWLQIGPLFLLPIGALGRLVEPWAGDRAAGVLIGAIAGAFVVWLAMGTARRAARLHDQPTEAARWVVGAALAVGGAVSLALEWGHPEEPLLGLLIVETGLLVARGRHAWAGAVLGVAAGVKLWGATGIGALVAARRFRGVVAAALTAGIVVALTYLPFVCFGQFGTTQHVWGFDGSTMVGWVAAHSGLSEWAVRAGEGAAVGCAGAAVARRRWSSPTLLALIVVTARLVIDPEPRPYFLSPAIAVALVWAWTSPSRGARRWRLLITVLSPLPVQLRAVLAPDQTWYAGLALVTAVTVGALVAEVREARRRVDAQPSAVAAGRTAAATTLAT